MAKAPKRRLGVRGVRAKPPSDLHERMLALAREAKDEGETADAIEAALIAAGQPAADAARTADFVDTEWAVARALEVQRKRAWLEIAVGIGVLGVGAWLSTVDTEYGPFGYASYVLGGGGALVFIGLHRLFRPKPKGFADRLTR